MVQFHAMHYDNINVKNNLNFFIVTGPITEKKNRPYHQSICAMYNVQFIQSYRHVGN